MKKQQPVKLTHALRSEVHQEYRRTTKFIQTTGDWYPTFAEGTVRGSVSIMPVLRTNVGVNPIMRRSGHYWGRVCFWGADDFGLERDWDFGADLDAAHVWFERWSTWLTGLTFVEKAQLRQLEFVNT